MSDTTLKTRIKLKYDTLENWQSNSSVVLLKGEVAIVEVPTGSSVEQVEPPAILLKVGDGTTTFANLPWVSGLSADVYEWAKASTKPSYTASEISGLEDSIIDNAPSYTLESGTADGSVKLLKDGVQVGSDIVITNFDSLATEDFVSSSIASAVGDIVEFDTQVVEELPEIGEKGVIYFVNHSHGENDSYDEYIYVNDTFEKIGNTDLDLSDYYTKTEVDTAIEEASYTLPVATSDTLGGVKVGAGLAILEDGTLSATGGGTADAVEWDNVLDRPFATIDETYFTTTSDELSIDTTAIATTTYVSSELANYVPLTSTINGHTLSSAITLTASDIGADASGTAQGLIDSLTYSDSAVSNQYITSVSQANGVISVVRKQIDYSEIASTPTIPTINTGSIVDLAGNTIYTNNQSDTTTITVIDCGSATELVD